MSRPASKMSPNISDDSLFAAYLISATGYDGPLISDRMVPAKEGSLWMKEHDARKPYAFPRQNQAVSIVPSSSDAKGQT